MYDRVIRFKKVYTVTPENLGPGTYYLSDIFDKNVPGSSAPFNYTQIRTSAFDNKSLAQNPSPNKYKICFRKNRIVGGTSMQNRAPRVKIRIPESSRGPYPLVVPKKLAGKLHTGVPPRGEVTAVSTIPEKGAEGYDLTDRGLVKVCHPPQNRAIGPTAYYNPEGHHNFTTLKYQGNFWSLRTAHRFRYQVGEGPSPAEYSVDRPPAAPWKLYQDRLQSAIRAQAPLLRTNDIIQQRLCRENLPGPALYSPLDPNTKKCDCGKLGTFTKSQRQDMCTTSDGPGPAAYEDPRTAFSKHKKGVAVKQAPFNVDAVRFPRQKNLSFPGPGDHDPQEGLWADLQKKSHSKYSKWNPPFDSSAVRNTAMSKADSCFTPGPDCYYPQFQTKGDRNRSSMFVSSPAASKTCSQAQQVSPGPAAYSVTEPFKAASAPKSHLHNPASAFLTSSCRLQPLATSSSPAPNTYHLPWSTLSTQGRTIGKDCDKSGKEITPGPTHYQVHPKYAKSSVFDTHNVTLQEPKTVLTNQQRKTLTKRLRCFSTKRYSTGHCPRICYAH